jgi:RNA polymerase sigma-70 factor (ECF subfamily)
MLSELTETDRAAVILQFWYDYTYDEIAETLDLSTSAVKSRLFRARRLLAEKWQDMQASSIPAPKPAGKRIAHESPTI